MSLKEHTSGKVGSVSLYLLSIPHNNRMANFSPEFNIAIFPASQMKRKKYNNINMINAIIHIRHKFAVAGVAFLSLSIIRDATMD